MNHDIDSVSASEKIKQEVSNYSLADEITVIDHSMIIAIPPLKWQIFQMVAIPAINL
ncbi:MAG: hypothetical protein F6K14_15950 [Symploca sp. SIO2C1]|nr:hypothetical protein [Symploca sp. SIO2C1]